MTRTKSHRIDVHCHSLLPSYKKALQEADLGVNVRLPRWSPELALEMMDRHDIAASITSISVPGTHLGDDGKAKDLARRCNDEAAAMTQRHPRLGAVATLPLPNVELACREAERALDQLGADGVGLLTGYHGKYLGHADYDELLAVLNDRSAVVLIHPAVHPSTRAVTLGVPNFVLEYPFDTTRAATNLLFADVLERFPNIKFVLSHGGGTLPFLAWRIAAIATWQMSQPPEDERFLKDNFPTALTKKYPVVTTDLVYALLKRFWYDTALVPDQAAMGAVRVLADENRILFGSDWPYAYEVIVDDEVKRLNDEAALPPEVRARVDRLNALELFPRLKTIVA
ncbi:amidohydrolase family protein [Roseiarcaceae bacterium H3SJ34-1]|uniref:amidohydrolase family protein n=1 Tax=Terripilifer ovatus TaxID=3032367 RepID=UPI003AB9A613|nr:amidohydrolase family protein [Roseiarcaceae bacterium H3SJ34-1]